MNVLAFDVETTSLIQSRLKRMEFQPYVIQICMTMVNLDTAEVAYQYHTFVRPPEREKLTEDITKITRIGWDTLERYETFPFYYDKVATLVAETPAVAAHNLVFDRDVLNVEAQRLGKQFRWPTRQICTIELTSHVKGHRLSLTDLYEYLFAMKFEDAHDARADVDALVRCLIELRRRDWI
jgi:DNA polymerase III epsilon subunit-like protein